LSIAEMASFSPKVAAAQAPCFTPLGGADTRGMNPEKSRINA